jgi:hypothetical protein
MMGVRIGVKGREGLRVFRVLRKYCFCNTSRHHSRSDLQNFEHATPAGSERWSQPSQTERAAGEYSQTRGSLGRSPAAVSSIKCRTLLRGARAA